MLVIHVMRFFLPFFSKWRERKLARGSQGMAYAGHNLLSTMCRSFFSISDNGLKVDLPWTGSGWPQQKEDLLWAAKELIMLATTYCEPCEEVFSISDNGWEEDLPWTGSGWPQQ